MNIARTAAIVLGAGAVAAWLSAAAVSHRSGFDAAPMRAAPIDARGDALADQIARLHERLRPASTPHQAGRNLFTFHAPAHAAPSAMPTAIARAAPAEAPSNAPAIPPLRLDGIGEDPGPDGPIRTAIISADGQLFIVKPGERVTPRYRVSRISSDVVELTDLLDGSFRRLALK